MTYMTRWQKFIWRCKRQIIWWLSDTPHCNMPSLCRWDRPDLSREKRRVSISSSEANGVEILPGVGKVVWDRRHFPLRNAPEFFFQTPDGHIRIAISGKFNEGPKTCKLTPGKNQ